MIWHSITHLEASSAQPLPSSALAWAAEQTQPSMPLWPGSADPEPHRFPQTHLHLSSWPEREGNSHCQNKCIIVKKWTSVIFLPSKVGLTTFHLSLTTSPTDRMSVCSAAPLILSALSYSLQLASVSQALHCKEGRAFRDQVSFLFQNTANFVMLNPQNIQVILLCSDGSMWLICEC